MVFNYQLWIYKTTDNDTMDGSTYFGGRKEAKERYKKNSDPQVIMGTQEFQY